MKYKYPEYIMEAVRGTLDLDEEDISSDEMINSMSKLEILDRVLQWDGIIGYKYRIISWIEDIFEVNLREVNK